MFNYTSTTVINGNADSTNKSKDHAGKKFWYDTEKNVFHVTRDFPFDKWVTEAYVRRYEEAKLFEAELDATAIATLAGTDGGYFRIALNLTRGNAVNTEFVDATTGNVKPVHIEFKVPKGTNDASKIATIIESASRKYLNRLYDSSYVSVAKSGTKVTFKGVDPLVRLKSMEVQQYLPTETSYNCCSQVNEFECVDGGLKLIEAGDPGFGSGQMLLDHYRLQMHCSGWGAPLQDEIPMLGGKYTQFTIYLCAPRGVLGQNAVGDVVKSLTTHVFFVEESAAEEFYTELKKLKVEKFGQEAPVKVYAINQDTDDKPRPAGADPNESAVIKTELGTEKDEKEMASWTDSDPLG